MSFLDNTKVSDTVMLTYTLFNASGTDITADYPCYFDLTTLDGVLGAQLFRSSVLASKSVPAHVIEARWCRDADSNVTTYYHQGQPTDYDARKHGGFIGPVLADLQPRHAH